MTRKRELELAIKFAEDEVHFLDRAIHDREVENLDASDLIARRSLKLTHIGCLKELLMEVK